MEARCATSRSGLDRTELIGILSSSTKVALARSPDLIARLAAVRCSAVQAGIRFRRS